MKISGSQITAARGLLKITQAELAAAAGVSEITVFRFEAGQAEPQRANLEKLLSELERRGIEFTNGDRAPSNDPGIGVRLNLTKAAAFVQAAGHARKEAEP
jgi:transcriptional regulator with XRE-family HTH domain